MRLYELISPEFKNTKKAVDYVDEPNNNKRYRADHKPIGGGALSTVQVDPRNQQDVIKTQEEPDEDRYMDGFRVWAEVTARYAKDCRFFPKIYGVDDRQDSSGRYQPRYRMEQLQSWRVANTKLLAHIYESTFDEDSFLNRLDEFSQQFNPGKNSLDETILDKIDTPESKRFWWASVVHDLESAINSGDVEFSQKCYHDGEILRVVARTACKKFGVKTLNDLHMDNMMIRITPYSQDVVVTDPLG